MIKRFCGELEIGLHYHGRTRENRAEYLGYVALPDGRRWQFADVQSAVGADGTRAADYDEIAEAAVRFAIYWTTWNRGDDTPEWAPAAELADAFEEAAEYGEETYTIHRKAPAAV